MIYKHIKKDHYIPGLPSGDIDSAAITGGQESLLIDAVAAGIYMPASFDKLARAGEVKKAGNELKLKDQTQPGKETE